MKIIIYVNMIILKEFQLKIIIYVNKNEYIHTFYNMRNVIFFIITL